MYGTIINVPTENYNYNPNQNFQSIPYTVNQLKIWSITAINFHVNRMLFKNKL